MHMHKNLRNKVMTVRWHKCLSDPVYREMYTRPPRLGQETLEALTSTLINVVQQFKGFLSAPRNHPIMHNIAAIK